MGMNENALNITPPIRELAVKQTSSLGEDYAICRQIMQTASKNYTFASRFLPTDKLPHVEALYALMRVGDDRVDVSHDGFGSPLAAIDDWERSYWRAFEVGDSPYPVLRAYLHTAQCFCIPSELLRPYFRAMGDDLKITRFTTFEDLLYYMEGSAMTVGRVMAHILGAETASIDAVYPEADALSIAMQLSNFWRDIGQDWQIGRVYIPQEDLDAFGYSEDELAAGVINDRWVGLLEFEFARTEFFYERARAGVCYLRSGRWGVMAALEIYRAIMPAIRQRNYDVFTQRATTTKFRKFGLALKARLLL